MSFLDTLTPHQREVLVSLPYRAGLWVSQSDDTGGAQADQDEKQVLSNILNGFAEEMFGSETLQYIMSETVASHEQWPRWAENLSSVLSDCAEAVAALAEYSDQKDVHAFQNHIIEIGEAVALAFREYDRAGTADKISLSLSYVLGKVKALITRRSYVPHKEFFNISARERKALNDLAQALGTKYSS